MFYSIDLEFYENGNSNPIVPISVGIAKFDLNDAINTNKLKIKKYYSVFSEFDENNLSDWLKENVVPFLDKPEEKRKTTDQIRQEIIDFIGDDDNPVFIGYYSAYDWVVFCQIFGAMIDLPDNFPMYCFDIAQLMNIYGIEKLSEQTTTEHNAINDAIHQAKNFVELCKKADLGFC